MFRPCFDVWIVGAGPAGSATAVALQNRGLCVGLSGLSLPSGRHLGESLRGVGCVALEELGLLESFEREDHFPTYLHRSSWAGHVLERHSIEGIHGPDQHLDRARFDHWLLDHARQRNAVTWVPARLEGVRWDGKRWQIELTRATGVRTVRARMLVDATGRNAAVSRKLGARRRRADRLVGIARWHAAVVGEPLVLVEAADDGWWYSAPVPGDELAALFITEPGIEAARATEDEVWTRCLESAPLTRERLSKVAAVGEHRAYAASPSLTVYEGDAPWLPVGDAALAFDPLSGDGLCFALRSALEAAECMHAALHGEGAALVAYHNGIEQVFEQHLRMRARYYEGERRVRPSAFWSRRAEGVSPTI